RPTAAEVAQELNAWVHVREAPMQKDLSALATEIANELQHTHLARARLDERKQLFKGALQNAARLLEPTAAQLRLPQLGDPHVIIGLGMVEEARCERGTDYMALDGIIFHVRGD